MIMNETRLRAVQLRKWGLTYSEIQLQIGKNIPKSTLSYWCRGVKLSERQLNRILALGKENLIRARSAAVRSKAVSRKRRLEEGYKQAKGYLGDVSLREAKIALAMLYLGEGYKFPASRGLKLGSSDPRIVNTFIHLLRLCFDVRPEDLKCLISYRADQNLDELMSFWAAKTGIPRDNFYQSKADPRTVNKPTKNSEYKGVAVVSSKGVTNQLELDHIANVLLEAISS